jgi:hypothetical protein
LPRQVIKWAAAQRIKAQRITESHELKHPNFTARLAG